MNRPEVDLWGGQNNDIKNPLDIDDIEEIKEIEMIVE